MNPETNKFEMLSLQQMEDNKRLEKAFGKLFRPNGEPVPQHWAQFQVGEYVVIKNYTFKVAYIGETSILFEPVGVVEVGNEIGRKNS